MSFGFSVGDFITVGRLVQQIVSSLKVSSISEYHEVILELHGLQRALYEIEHLKCHPSQVPAVNSIKVAALMCQYPLDEFAGKLKKFESLGPGKAEHAVRLEKVRMWSKKLRWGFCMEEEVMKLRAYLIVHVGSLNTRLITQGLRLASFVAEQSQKGHEDLETKVEKSHMEMITMRQDLQENGSLARNNNSILTRLSSLITGDVVSQLKTLVDLASKVWQSNMQIMNFIINIQSLSPSPDLRYTWVQEPVKFEDAMGRIIPIPSEYNLGKVEAIIMAQFPGSKKVWAGEYELFNTLDSSQVISRAENEALTPGLNITMGILVAQYPFRSLDRCVRRGCKSDKLISNESGGKICCICKAYFDHARESLSLPLPDPNPDFVPLSHRTRGMKQNGFPNLASESNEFEERMFKNFRTQMISSRKLRELAESLQDAKAKLQRHLRTAQRHNRSAGLKCPQPECLTKDPMRSDNLGPHLLKKHKEMSAAEREAVLDK